MSFNFNGVPSAEVSISGAVTIEKNTALFAQATATGTMLTVGAGKVARILGVEVVAYTAGAQGSISLNGAIAIQNICLGSTSVAFKNWSYDACPVLTAGQTVICNETGGSAWFGLSYVLEDA